MSRVGQADLAAAFTLCAASLGQLQVPGRPCSLHSSFRFESTAPGPAKHIQVKLSQINNMLSLSLSQCPRTKRAEPCTSQIRVLTTFKYLRPGASPCKNDDGHHRASALVLRTLLRGLPHGVIGKVATASMVLVRLGPFGVTALRFMDCTSACASPQLQRNTCYISFVLLRRVSLRWDGIHSCQNDPCLVCTAPLLRHLKRKSQPTSSLRRLTACRKHPFGSRLAH